MAQQQHNATTNSALAEANSIGVAGGSPAGNANHKDMSFAIKYRDMDGSSKGYPSTTAAAMFDDPTDGREGATSPSQIESSHRDEVQHMGCTCKKTRCLKLYCQCFGVKLYCGPNCRCFQCFNVRRFDKERKNAMRAILQRNPGAFDTKFFKKQQREDAAAAAAAQQAGDAAAASELAKSIAHKVGCKCRKSACMKKVSFSLWRKIFRKLGTSLARALLALKLSFL